MNARLEVPHDVHRRMTPVMYVARFEMMRSRGFERSPVVCCLFVALASALSFDLGAERIWRASEERCFAVVNKMVRSGNWLVPRLAPGAQPRLQKPPLFDWAATAAADLAGGASIVTLRSVSVLASLAVAGVVFAWGCSIGGFAQAVASVLALAGTTVFVVRARYGDAEALLALTTLLALATFERLWRTRDARFLPVLAASVALAILTKATAALLAISAPLAVWLALHGSLRLAFRPRVLAWGVVALTAGLAWHTALLIVVPGAMDQLIGFALQPVGATAGEFSAAHFRSVFFYLPRFPVQSLAASLLLPWIIRDAIRTRFWRDDNRVRFLATSAVSIFVAWSLVPQKQMHYLLPLTPLFALLCGDVVSRGLEIDT